MELDNLLMDLKSWSLNRHSAPIFVYMLRIHPLEAPMPVVALHSVP